MSMAKQFLGTGGTSTGDPVCLCVCFTKLFENFQNRFRDYYSGKDSIEAFLRKQIKLYTEQGTF